LQIYAIEIYALHNFLYYVYDIVLLGLVNCGCGWIWLRKQIALCSHGW